MPLFKQHKIHAYQQLEYSDCGQTCIRIICRYYGFKIDNRLLRHITDASRIGMSIGDIASAFRKLSCNSAVAKFSIDRIFDIPMPTILYWNQSHFVVLYRIDARRKKFYIVDPAVGKRVLDYEAFMHNFCPDSIHGVAVLIDIDENSFKNIENRGTRNSSEGLLHWVTDLVHRHSREVVGILILTVFTIVTDLIFPFLFQKTIDDGISGRDIGLIWILVGGQLMIFLGNLLSGCFSELIFNKLGLNISMTMLNQYLMKLVKLPMTFFSRKVEADLIQKIEDNNRIKNFILLIPETMFLTIINIIIFSILLIYYNSLIYWIFIISTIGAVLWSTLFLRLRREIDCSLTTKTAFGRNVVYEMIEGIEEIKSHNAQSYKIKCWKDNQDIVNDLTTKSVKKRFFQTGGVQIIQRLRDVIITGICATLVTQDSMSMGVMMTISYIIGRLSSPFFTFISSINLYQDASLSYQRLDEILNYGEPQEDKPQDHLNIDAEQDIIIKDLSFKYPGYSSKYVLNSLNLEIPRNSVTAIVGESGCGKSTLLKVIGGLYPHDEGNILWGLYDYSELSENMLHDNISVVSQSGTIFSGTIIENVALASNEYDLEAIKNACRIACIHEFIESLPMGYYTKIGKLGLELSGGQKQRLYIARAVYRNCKVLILDEATSSLDAKTEKNVIENLFEYSKNKTLIIAAHRLSTIKNSDNIVVMDCGKIVEQGNHDYLIRLGGYYYDLIENQISVNDY